MDVKQLNEEFRKFYEMDVESPEYDQWLKNEVEQFKQWFDAHKEEIGFDWVGRNPIKYGQYSDKGVHFEFQYGIVGGYHNDTTEPDPSFSMKQYDPHWFINYWQDVQLFKTREELQNYLLEHPYKEWMQTYYKVLPLPLQDEVKHLVNN